MNPPFIYFWRCKEISREAMINEEIRAKELRVIAADGTQLGIMSREEALALSEEKRLIWSAFHRRQIRRSARSWITDDIVLNLRKKRKRRNGISMLRR